DAIDGKTITGAFIRTAATGRRLELAPPGATFPEMRFYPAGSTNYSVLRTRGDRASGEATLTITSSQTATANYRAQLEMSARLTTINVIDSNSGNPKGGFLEISDDNAIFGWYAGSPNTECYIALDGSGRWKVVGRYWDFGEDDPYDAVVAGSASIGGGSAPNWAIFSYGPTMVTNMGPVVTLRDGASGGPTAFGNNFVPVPWALTASSTQGFQINLSTGSSFAFYFWAHRH